MTPSEYEYLQKLLKERSGLVLSADKQYLVESRLIPLARRSGLGGIGDLVAKMKMGAEPLVVAVVEAMTTNETFFFRDKVPFDHFRETIMPSMLEARKHRRSIRIWCAASSTGQEPYSLAMILKDMGASLSGWRVEIVATDLSQEVLEKSKSGIFSQFEVQRGLPIQLLVKHFTPDQRDLAALAGNPGHGAVQAAQPAARLLASRHVRCHLLPQRADLLRSGHQGERVQSPCEE